MTIIAMDQDAVRAAIRELNTLVDDSDSSLDSGTKQVKEDVEGWKSAGSEKFESRGEKQKNVISSDIDTIGGMAGFLEESIRAIDYNEEVLSQLKI